MNGFELARRQASIECKLPEWMLTTIDGFCNFHMVYTCLRRGRIFSKIDLSHQERAIVFSAGMQFLSNRSEFVKYSVELLLISKCATDLLVHYRSTMKAYEDFRKAWKGQYPIYQSVKVHPLSHGSIQAKVVSPALRRNSFIGLGRTFLFIKMNGKTGCIFVWECFKSSMCLLDIYLIFNRDCRGRFEACTDLVANCEDYSHELRDNFERLYEKLQKKAVQVDCLLSLAGVDITGLSTSKILDQARVFATYEFSVMKNEAAVVGGMIYNPHAFPHLEITFEHTHARSPFSSSSDQEEDSVWQGELIPQYKVPCTRIKS
jgi:hypothetical protein